MMQVILVVVCVLSATAAAFAQTGADVYAAACATCHGADGRGTRQEVVAFDDALPDFRDCSFATREPDADWLAVVHDGGPARAFGRMMPAFRGALSIEQMSAAIAHVRTFCDEPAWPRGELNFPRPLVTEKAFPEDEAVWTVSVDSRGDEPMQHTFVYEHRLGPRNQVEAIVPFTADGIGDVAIGAKRAVFHSVDRGAIFSLAGELILPTGDEAAGLSKGTATFEPFVAFGQALPGDGFVQVQAGAEVPFDRDNATPEAFWRTAVGRTLSQNRWGRAWTPLVEILAARELDAGEPVLWDLVPQLQVSLSTRQHILLSGGVRTPLNRRADRGTRVLLYVLWDWFDGPLLEGW